METQYDSPEDAAGEPVRVSPRLLWFIGLLLAVLLAGGGYVVTEHIMTSKAIEQLGRSVAHGVPPAATRPPAAAVPPVPPPAPAAAQPESPWIGGDADLAAETSGSSRAAGGAEVPGGALRLSGGAERVDGQAAFDTAGGSGAGAEGGAGPAAVREEGRGRRARAPGYEMELEKHYSTVFARCPRPGVPGAVECRRAVCAGGARKSAACRYYADGSN